MKKRKHGKCQKKRYLKLIMIFSIIIFFSLSLIQSNDMKTKEQISNSMKTNQSGKEMVKTQEKENKNEIEKQIKKDEENNKIANNEILSKYNGYPVIAKLEIEKINLDTLVLKEHNKQTLATSVTKFFGANPNEIGNFCIAGHNYITKNMFHNLKKVNVGDKIKLTDLTGRSINYKVYKKSTVLPNETQCLSQKTNGRTELTLITCTTDSSKRIVIKAIKEGEEKLLNE
ncbi:MAG: sortase [Clostridia bacterium]|nr:sortase [Clostridium sp.]